MVIWGTRKEQRLSVFLAACRSLPVPYTPVWLMRQAGRYLPEYREVRSRSDFLTMCRTPELAAEVTLQPLRRFPLDAAIVFSDILLPLQAMGRELHFTEDGGPRLPPLRERREVEELRPVGEEDFEFLAQTVRLVCRELGDTPLIGFAGAPFTLASYAVEGGASRLYLRTKRLMWEDPSLWGELMERLVQAVEVVLAVQVRAGARAVQLFDSWAGVLSPRDYREKVWPYSRRVVERARALGVPVIHFVHQGGGFLELIAQTGADVVGLDWRVSLREARLRLGNVAVQGNLDPAVLLSTPRVIEEAVRGILEEAEGRPGHIFNLGHGVLKDTPPENVAFLVETVHRLSRR